MQQQIELGLPPDLDDLPRFAKLAPRWQELLADWKNAFPGVDVHRELKKAHAWCVSNPRRAPKKDLARFCYSWLSRAEEDSKPALPAQHVDPSRKTLLERIREYLDRTGEVRLRGVAYTWLQSVGVLQSQHDYSCLHLSSLDKGALQRLAKDMGVETCDAPSANHHPTT